MNKRILSIIVLTLFAVAVALYAAHTFDFLGFVRSIHGR